METDLKVRHLAYGISIMVLFNRFLYLCAECFQFTDMYKALFFGVLGVVALLVGLFKFHKGLSLGLVIGGIVATRLAWLYYHIELTDLLQFLLSIIILIVLSFALYRLYKQH